MGAGTEQERRDTLFQELVGLCILYRRAAAAIARGDELDTVLRPVEVALLASSPIEYVAARMDEARNLFARIGIDFDATFEAALADLQARNVEVFERSPIPTMLN